MKLNFMETPAITGAMKSWAISRWLLPAWTNTQTTHAALTSRLLYIQPTILPTALSSQRKYNGSLLKPQTFSKQETSSQFCSFVDQVCVYHIKSSKLLPEVTVGLVDNTRTRPKTNSTCSSHGVHLSGRTAAEEGFGDIGMKFDAQVQALASAHLQARCGDDGTMIIPGGKTKSVTFILATGTEYDASKGNAAHDYSFRGDLPYASIMKTIDNASKRCYSSMLKDHIADHHRWMSLFRLDLPDPNGSANVDTAQLLTDYTWDKGDPFVENLMVDYGKYMYIASSREGSLPPNLQGVWAPDLAPAWSSDYHIDINVQMSVAD